LSNLERFKSAGIVFEYISVDITDADQLHAAVEKLQDGLGPITGILHGAARNEPRLMSDLDEESFRQTVAVKVQGARNLLDAINPQKLKLLVTFGSIIARTGLPGEADYGLANEWLTELTKEWKSQHPHCRCLALEWSIWAGKGMGERLGRTDRLLQQGITPIPLDAGVETLLDLLHLPLPDTSVIVMSRFRDLPTFKIERPELPFLRFLEQPTVFFPGTELVVNIDLSTTTDPYLEDHVFQGERIFPAVMGLEAMTQVASALMETKSAFVLENIKFNQPVVVTRPVEASK
jgi:enediyne polyketide synthase